MSLPFLLSIYDATGVWSWPYARAGWRVLRWDYEYEGCILRRFGGLYNDLKTELKGKRLTGLIAAPPCKDFANSGARWWDEKDAGLRWWKGEEQGDWYGQYFKSTTERSEFLVLIVLELRALFNPYFWALEQPRGRITKLIPELKPYKKLRFDPWEFGDPWTKETYLYGEFNTDLKRTPVEPSEGSKMWKVPPGPERDKIRSQTPEGFAWAFYEANHKEYGHS